MLEKLIVCTTHKCYALYILRMRKTPPAPDVLSSLFPTPCLSAQWESTWRRKSKCMQTATMKARSRECPDPGGSNMFFVEMVEMVDILKWADYDGKYGPYLNPNVRKAKIMAKVVKSLRRNFGVRRSKDQLRKRWSDLKLRKQDQYRKIKRVLQKREKRLRTSEDTRDPPPPKEKQIPTPQPEDVEEGEVYEVGKIVTTTGDVDVVEEETSAHVLIGEIMVCNRDLQKIKEDISDVEKILKNIIDVLGRI
ncbi:hypothetical protein AB205_0037240 [Aquarana catesbeiana]|uniref:Uncharacterized protein n=2 Tax=Aquarana catesbeiana TaxID=8400 RepID=A0A2G9R9B5_AQUCT|nr:hypothetical protein AB205_0037240 [Aquarana catesbeiana]